MIGTMDKSYYVHLRFKDGTPVLTDPLSRGAADWLVCAVSAGDGSLRQG
jgi:hypothetical protein